MIETKLNEKALLVIVDWKVKKDWTIEDSLAELTELVKTSRTQVMDKVICHPTRLNPTYLIGKGKVEEINQICEYNDIDVVIFSEDLSGTQQRNLEEIIGKKTIDRTQLILDIFAQHAKSPEGKMQVELAQLQYLLPRLIGKGIILSRLGGGIGSRGPGEQKLEVDRRRIRKRIEKLKSDLRQVAQHRLLLRKKRKENAIATVALVGYTNAGKSTLINALTNAGQVVTDSLFTTLDPLAKKMVLPNGEHIILLDTVGFLNSLPHHLIEAFKATLEEVVEADLLIHVLDVSHSRVYERNTAVINVLKELEAEKKPMIVAFNKIDLLDDRTWLERLKADFPNSVAISAKLKQNLDILLSEIQKNFVAKMTHLQLIIPHSRMDLVDLFYRQGKVEEIKYLQKGIEVKVNLPDILYYKLLHNKEIEIVS